MSVSPSAPSVATVSASAFGLDASLYAPVDLEKLYDPKWNEKDVTLETIVEPPKKDPGGDPLQVCRPAQEGTLGFPDVDTPGAPICFRLERGKIDPASVIPRQTVRARMRGRFHKSPAVDDPVFVDRTWITLDAFEVVPEADYAPMTVAQIKARGASVHLEKVVVEGEWFGVFESWTIYDVGAASGRGDAGMGPSLCLTTEQQVGGASRQRARVRGHVFAHGGYGHMDGCNQILLIDSVDLL